ncbi:MAG: hypothetical protein RL660_1259 [Bacteroidota bacterium]|jgi:putative SOS response-associated peptidase YedK
MCGTASNNKPRKAVEERFKANFAVNVNWEPIRLAKAFANDVLPVITNDASHSIQMFEWGLIPSFAKNIADAQKLRTQTINCRTETIFEKVSFKYAAQHQRCLVLLDGFVEYQHTGNTKQPYYITLKTGELFAVAGLYNTWLNAATGEYKNTFSIATVPANPLMARIHNSKERMPLILTPETEQQWLNAKDTEEIKALFTSLDEATMHAHPITADIGKRDFVPHKQMYDPITIVQQGSLF